MNIDKRSVQWLQRIMRLMMLFTGCILASCIVHLGIVFDWFTPHRSTSFAGERKKQLDSNNGVWQAPDLSTVSETKEGALIRYGRELVEHTAFYLGPEGTVDKVSNGMNCQNCHLAGGTRPFGNNYGAVASRYPKFRNRSGTVEGFEKRINDCFQRSLNGVGLKETSREMKAMVAYLRWVGKDVTKDESPKGFGFVTLSPLDRPADPVRGKTAYVTFCARCHGTGGEGEKAGEQPEWKYPPLWGSQSYNTGAGLYRLSKFAAFIKANMPFGITHENPLLTDEEAWDIAAFVNSMPRPHKEFPGDWPDLSKKPKDHPFGPYADERSEKEHKYGPW